MNVQTSYFFKLRDLSYWELYLWHKIHMRDGEMVQWLKALTHKLSGLSLNSRMQGGNRGSNSQKLSADVL